MAITKEIVEKARELRRQAAAHWGCEVSEIDWPSCMSIAMRGENQVFEQTEEEKEMEMKRIEELEKENAELKIENAALIAEIEALKVIEPTAEPTAEPKTVNIELCWNAYKGSGKAWLARVDLSAGGRVTSRDFVDPIATDRNGSKGSKEYELPSDTEQIYESCESGSKKSDDRKLFRVISGKIVNL